MLKPNFHVISDSFLSLSPSKLENPSGHAKTQIESNCSFYLQGYQIEPVTIILCMIITDSSFLVFLPTLSHPY